MRTAEVMRRVDDNPADTDLTSGVLTHNGRPIHIGAQSRFCVVKESTTIGFFLISWFLTIALFFAAVPVGIVSRNLDQTGDCTHRSSC
jgi:hypothetical protein